MPATDPPDPDQLTAALLGGGSPWTSITVVAAAGSTNADLVRAARNGARPGSVLITDNQTAGRGRLNREWIAPPGASTATSVLVKPEVPATRWPWLSLMTGVGLVDGIRAVCDVPVGLKWPNDVVVPGPAGTRDRKLCGLLAERVETSHGPCAVLGFGINVAMNRSQLPVEWATSLLLEGAEVDKTALLISVLRSLGEAYALFVDHPQVLAEHYAERCLTLGRDVRVHLGDDEDVTGQAVGIDPSGALHVRTAAGERIFSAGDVMHLR